MRPVKSLILKDLSPNDPIIARISRNKFEMVIKAMDLGVYTVFADDDFGYTRLE